MRHLTPGAGVGAQNDDAFVATGGGNIFLLA
jgi:hypothetical protein